jgi:hypothetical protein
MTTPTASTGDIDRERFDRARTWMWNQGASGWVADAFGHCVIAEVAPHQSLPEDLSQLWLAWSYDPVPCDYRAHHGARPVGAPPRAPGVPLPAPTAP